MSKNRDSQRILVTGSNGWLGRSICARLKDEGVDVIAADLKKMDGPWSSFVEIDLCADPIANQFATKELACSGRIDALIHCAGYAHRPHETPDEVARFHAINAEGTRHTLQWAKTLGVERFVYLSSIAFYNWNDIKGPADEESPLDGKTAYAASKLAGEEAVVGSGLDYRVVRLATVFGEGDRANFAKLAAALRRRRFLLPDAGQARKSVISVNRAAEWIAALTVCETCEARILNLGFAQAPSLSQICEAYSEVCNFPRPPRLPIGLLKVGCFVGDQLSRVIPSFPLTSQILEKLTLNTEVNCERAASIIPEIRECTFEAELAKASAWYVDAR